MTTIAGRYELQEKVGTGGEANVFRARDMSTGGEVALRLQHHAAAPALLPVPTLQHPGWVRLLDAGNDAEHGSFLAFELLRGPTLRRLIEQQPLSVAVWDDFVASSLDAVEALHQAGWIHNDLNADNWLRAGDEGWKLLELPFHDWPKSDKPLFGSIYTLAPEQLAGEPASVVSNLFSLGCLYYYAAAGVYPHAGSSSSAIAVERLRFPAEPLSAQAPQLSPARAAFVLHLLARDPSARPTDVSAARRLLDTP